MKNFKAIVILLIIILLLSYAQYISYNVVEKFLFIDNQTSTLPVNKNMLIYSILLPDDAVKHKHNDMLIKRIGVTNDIMLKNLIKYNDKQFSSWIINGSNTKEQSVIKEICKYISHCVKKNNKVIFYKLNKYKYAKSSDAAVLDIDFVFDKGLHSKIICMVEFSTKYIQYFSIKVIGTISEDKLWQSENYDTDENDNDIDYSENGIDQSMIDLMYSDTCLSMKTQDEQLHNLLCAKLLYVPDKAVCDHLQHLENHNKVRAMFMDKLSERRHKKMNNCYKNYPYKDDFSISA